MGGMERVSGLGSLSLRGGCKSMIRGMGQKGGRGGVDWVRVKGRG